MYMQGREQFHQIIQRLELREEGLQRIKRQRARPVAFGLGRIRVRFQEETSQANRQAGTRQIDDLFAAPARGGGAGLALLQGMSHVENRSEERRVGKECRSRWSPYH